MTTFGPMSLQTDYDPPLLEFCGPTPNPICVLNEVATIITYFNNVWGINMILCWLVRKTNHYALEVLNENLVQGMDPIGH